MKIHFTLKLSYPPTQFATDLVQKLFPKKQIGGQTTPMATNFGKNLSIPVRKHPFHYRSLIGFLQWLANGTRPDIAYAVNRLASKVENPGQQDFIGIKRIIRYLNITSDFNLNYIKTN